MTADDDLLFARTGALATVTLNRPKALNALTMEMCLRLEAQLGLWAEDPEVDAVLIKGTGERAFCAGGDIVAIYNSGRGDGKVAAEFFRAEYRLNRRVFHFPKPYIAVIDGITMGGGVGVSVHGSHRLASEHTLFAMPETGIGFFPDVGGTYFLPRLPGALGLYLGLTGARLKAADSLAAGVATQVIESAALGELEAALGEADLSKSLEGILADFAAAPGEAPLAALRPAIDRCFGQNSLETILAALEAEAGEWAEKTLSTLRAASPTSLKITVKQLVEGRDLAFDDAMTREYRLSQACLARHDFLEGIRAAVIDKDRQPAWDPAALADVNDALVDAHFESLGARDLVFD
ncbi:MAG: enoyl-CoA hydratase/isomerase family protein [Pseudomonadota bacterium]